MKGDFMTYTYWDDAHDREWHQYREGVNRLYSEWIERALAAVSEDPEILVTGLSMQLNPKRLRDLLERHRNTFLGSPRDPDIRNASRQVGFAHIQAHVPPSAYVSIYNLLFDAYHGLEEDKDIELPPLALVRRRWLQDMQTTLDTYETALSMKITALDDMAHTDSLTGLLNRRGVARRMRKHLQSPTSPAFLIVIDLDYYKRVNDLHGHPVGDQTLITFANLARQLVHENDVLGRAGGDEFIWLMDQQPDLRTLASCLGRLDDAFCQQTGLTFTCGVARYPLDGTTLEQLYHQADRALYQAKHAGRHCWALPDGEPQPFSKDPRHY